MTTIQLIPTTLDHVPSLFSIFSSSEMVQFTNFKTFEAITAFEIFMAKFLAIEKGSPLQYGPYCITLMDTTIIGLCGLQQIDLVAGKAELWYVLHKDYWGRGIAKKAVALLLAMAKENPHMQTIYAEAVGSNAPSWRILQHHGFVQTATLPNGFVKGAIVADLGMYTLYLRQ